MLRYRNLLRQSSHYNKSIISPFYLSNSSRSIQTKSQQRDKAFVGVRFILLLNICHSNTLLAI